jgi:hypothetical protein
MITTLNKIRSHKPCREGWEKLLRHLVKTAADDEPLAIATVLDSNGLDDALWCLRAVEGRDREIRLYAVWAARRVQHLMTDPRSFTALDVAEEYARGRASTAKLTEAAEAAWAAAAASSAEAARAAEAAWVAEAAAEAEAASAAAAAAEAAAWETRTAAYISSRDAARAAQADELRRICQEIEAGRDPYPEEDGR